MPDIQEDNLHQPKPNIPIPTGINTSIYREEIPQNSSQRQIKYPPFLWDKTQDLIRQIEEKINMKILVYFTSNTTRITNDDVEYFFAHLREIEPGTSLGLILISNGGSVTASWRIASLLRSYCKDLTVIIPSRCASAATLLSLSADKILFGPTGFLTAIDSSMMHELNPRPNEKAQPVSVSVDQVNRISNYIIEDLKNHPNGKGASEIMFEKIHPIVFAELQRSSSLSKLVAKNMMKLRINPPSEEETLKIANLLNDAYPAHIYPIVFKEASEMGLPVEKTSNELSSLLWEMVKIYVLITKPVYSDLTSISYHFEEMPVVIESLNKRTYYAISKDSKISDATKLWYRDNDKTGWYVAKKNNNLEQNPVISQILD